MSFLDTIRTHCRPASPQPTGTLPRLTTLDGIRAVFFDIYGTLLTSSSGDIGSNPGAHREARLSEVSQLFQLELTPSVAIEAFDRTVLAHHAAARDRGIEYPEVDIARVWEDALREVARNGVEHVDFEAFALEFEVRVNPTWPMPGLVESLSALCEAGLVLGIVSNAQFFTPMLFPALVGRSLETLGFALNLSYFSYEHGHAKPGIHLYELAREQLVPRQIAAHETVYVGNDMLNDIAAASAVGFRTALFAGDQRSLRLRTDDVRVGNVQPDLVLTELPQLVDCLTTPIDREL